MTEAILDEVAQQVLDLVWTQDHQPTRVFVEYRPEDATIIDALPRVLRRRGLGIVEVCGHAGPQTALVAVEFPGTDLTISESDPSIDPTRRRA